MGFCHGCGGHGSPKNSYGHILGCGQEAHDTGDDGKPNRPEFIKIDKDRYLKNEELKKSGDPKKKERAEKWNLWNDSSIRAKLRETLNYLIKNDPELLVKNVRPEDLAAALRDTPWRP